MDDMVEKVARAICDAGQGQWRKPPYNELHTDALNNHWRHKARAAIEAMREPSEAMVKAGYDAFMAWDARTGDDLGMEIIWRAMIDAALSDTKGGQDDHDTAPQKRRSAHQS